MSGKELPSPTSDLATLRHDITEYGYAIVADALSPEQVAAMKARLIEQALCEAKERGGSIDLDDEHANGFIQSLLNKGAVWQDLIDPSDTVHQVLDHAFTPAFDPIMSQTQPLDQKYISFAMGSKFKRKDRLRVGHARASDADALRPTFHIDQKWAAGHLDYPIIVTVFFALTDFNYANGCTLVVPGSHKIPTPAYGVVHDDQPPQPNGRPAWAPNLYSDLAPEVTAEAVTVEVPAGTAFIFEGRLWHAAGINTSGELRAHVNTVYCAPYIRQRDLFPMNLRQDVIDQLSDEQLMMLGFDTVFRGDGDGLMGRIEPTLGRTNLSNKPESFGELHDETLVPA